MTTTPSIDFAAPIAPVGASFAPNCSDVAALAADLTQSRRGAEAADLKSLAPLASLKSAASAAGGPAVSTPEVALKPLSPLASLKSDAPAEGTSSPVVAGAVSGERDARPYQTTAPAPEAVVAFQRAMAEPLAENAALGAAFAAAVAATGATAVDVEAAESVKVDLTQSRRGAEPIAAPAVTEPAVSTPEASLKPLSPLASLKSNAPAVGASSPAVAVSVSGASEMRPYQAQAADLAQSRRTAEPIATQAAGASGNTAPEASLKSLAPLTPLTSNAPAAGESSPVVAGAVSGERDARPYQAADLAQSRRGAEPLAALTTAETTVSTPEASLKPLSPLSPLTSLKSNASAAGASYPPAVGRPRSGCPSRGEMRPYQAETPVVAGEAAIVAVPLAGERDARPYQAQAADLAQSRRGAEPAADALVAAGVAPQVAPQTGAVPAGASEMRPYQAAASAAASATAAAAAPAPSTVLVQAAQAVADTLLVSPGLLRGQGEIVVQLRPDVLEGTEVRIAVTGRQLDVQFCPTTVNMAVLLEGSRTQIASHLSAKIASFNVTVDVRKKRT